VSSETIAERILTEIGPRLAGIYGEHRASILVDELIALLRNFAVRRDPRRLERWNQQDVILISYGDSIRQPDTPPLQTLKQFLDRHLQGRVSTVHLLPFFPFSSDDGFSVIDYTQVNQQLGSWEDVRALGETFDLMIDLVINHVSRESLWFIDFINNRPPACYYFIEMDPAVDLSEVVRPRKSNILTPVHTHRGLKHVWSTFSEDQIDVNFANPNVLLEFVKILLFYLRQGGRFLRLDAVAFLWKKLGTNCINLPETHEIVKVLRSLLELAAPAAVLLTETNLPSRQNLSYFGAGDEAHMVYQFSLAPLLLHALFQGNGRFLTDWAAGRCEPPAGCTFLNFTASHDGIGLRPAEGLLASDEIQALIDAMRQFGGFVSMKSNPDGSESPYEINISLFDAFKGCCHGIDQWQVARFLCSQTVMLGLKGIPALYIHSLFASPNDLAGVENSGRTRSINRRTWQLDELEGLLADSGTPNHIVFQELRRLLRIRRHQPAFHPDAAQDLLSLGDAWFAFRRTSRDGQQVVLAISNLTDRPQTVSLAAQTRHCPGCHWIDLLRDGLEIDPTREQILRPYQTLWLAKRD
jgi:sucrose phosphorylase